MNPKVLTAILLGGVLIVAVFLWPEPAAQRAPTETTGGQVAPGTTVEGVGTLVTSLARQQLAGEDQMIDPRHDGWQTEAFNDAAGAQLHRLAELLTSADDWNADRVAPLLDAEFTCSAVRPRELETVWDEHGLTVRRTAPSAEVDAAAELEFRGVPGMIEAFVPLHERLADYAHREVKFKLVRIDTDADVVATSAYFHAAGRSDDGAAEYNAKLDCRWRRASDSDGAPRLLSLAVTDYEEAEHVAGENGVPTLFADCTEAVMAGSPAFTEQLRHGTNHWVRRIETIFNMFLEERYGMALGDVNGDGLDDVFICQPGGLPDRLLLHRPDGTVVDGSAEAGVDLINHTGAALLIDLDNDGDQDLVVASYLRAWLWANDGAGRFKLQDMLTLADHDLRSLTAADYDNDGDLDLFICVGRSRRSSEPFVYHDARNGGANKLYRNDISDVAEGAWRFTDVTDEVGLGEENYRHSQAAAWEDFDNDGDQDLYVANDFGPNCLYRNDGGRFVDIAEETGVRDFASGMSVSWSDYNRDGFMDLYVGNMFSSAGNRITTQSRYMPEAGAKQLYYRFAKGNSLFQGLGGGKFREVGDTAHVEMGRWAWSSLFFDLNTDGWDDLVVANGFITGEDSQDL